MLIILISIFIAIYVCEIYLTLSDKPLTLERFEKTIKLTNEQKSRREFLYKTGKNFDNRTGLEIYEDLKSKNKK